MEPCPHRPPCSACPRYGEPGIPAAARGALDTLARAHGLPAVAVTSGSVTGFRHRARLAIRGRVGSPKLGLFEAGTHRVVHVPNCVVHHPLINRVAGVVRRALVDARVSSYSDIAHLGVARYLQIVVERSTQTAQVVLVGNCDDAHSLADCLNLIRERLGSDLHSLWFNSNRERGNAILGPEFQHAFGPHSVIERFGGHRVHYPPGAFGQNNLDLAQSLIAQVSTAIPADARVAEYYAGVGAIGLSVAPRCAALHLNEVSPQSLLGLDLGLAELAPGERSKFTVSAGTAGTALEAARDADVIIANPPRKGLDAALTAYLVEHAPARFIYVSCGLESFLRDTAQLTARDTLRLTALSAFDLLPFTDHVETLAVFESR